MKTIGLLGGMSWESTTDYYQAINEGVKKRLGGLHSAKIAMVSVDFDPIEKFQHGDLWEEAAAVLCSASRNIQAAGADFLLICTNTMHKVAPQIQAAIDIPILHIADATAEVLVSEGINTVGLLGTAFTMEQDFYKGRLKSRFGIDTLVPEKEDRKRVHQIIFEELCLGQRKVSSKSELLRIIDKLGARGAQAVILGCTEIGMLIQQQDTSIKIFDTTAIHAERAVQMALDTNSSI